VTGLLDPTRLERLETIRAEAAGGNGLTAAEVIQALLHQAFPPQPASSPMQSVVQVEVAEGIMDLAADHNAPQRVSSAAWAGVDSLQAQLKRSLAQQPQDATLQRLQAETDRFVRNPQQFAPHRLPTPAPTGPPVGGGM
jgi:hypothetical protein